MAELRSFIIGVTIAGIVLVFAGLVFGVFGSSGGNSPSVRLLGTPPATRTPAPATTRSPSEFTPVVPTAISQLPPAETPGEGTPAAETPLPGVPTSPLQSPTPTPTLEVAPTAAPTATPQTNEVTVYVDSANQYTPSLVAQIEYLIGNTSAPAVGDPSWKSFTLESAQYVQGLAGSLASIPAPACVASAHGGLVAAANQASAAASQVAAAVNADNPGAVTSAGAGLAGARDAINSAVADVSATIGSSC
jgi:hypothetical protein